MADSKATASGHPQPSKKRRLSSSLKGKQKASRFAISTDEDIQKGS